jgi:hypothetical protein
MSFRYTLPDSPIAAVTADIGHVAVDLALTLRGEVHVACPDTPHARRVLDRISEGVFISGLGTGKPSVTCAVRHKFTQTATSFLAPSTMRFSGPGVISFAEDSVRVSGDVEYHLAVTVTPHNVEPQPQADAAAWFTANGGTLAAIGAVVLIGRSV